MDIEEFVRKVIIICKEYDYGTELSEIKTMTRDLFHKVERTKKGSKMKDRTVVIQLDKKKRELIIDIYQNEGWEKFITIPGVVKVSMK